jgi:hypothetical protein
MKTIFNLPSHRCFKTKTKSRNDENLVENFFHFCSMRVFPLFVKVLVRYFLKYFKHNILHRIERPSLVFRKSHLCCETIVSRKKYSLFFLSISIGCIYFLVDRCEWHVFHFSLNLWKEERIKREKMWQQRLVFFINIITQ